MRSVKGLHSGVRGAQRREAAAAGLEVWLTSPVTSDSTSDNGSLPTWPEGPPSRAMAPPCQ
eukprot:4583256-Pyramimonas_sp.AAC.1